MSFKTEFDSTSKEACKRVISRTNQNTRLQESEDFCTSVMTEQENSEDTLRRKDKTEKDSLEYVVRKDCDGPFPDDCEEEKKENLEMLQEFFENVGGDLEEIQNLLLKLYGVLRNGNVRELNSTNVQRNLSSEGVHNTSTLKEVSDAKKDDESQEQTEVKLDVKPSGVEFANIDNYSTLFADIELLKSNLFSLQRNLED